MITKKYDDQNLQEFIKDFEDELRSGELARKFSPYETTITKAIKKLQRAEQIDEKLLKLTVTI